MTRDAKESLTALVAVSGAVGLFCVVLLLIPDGLQIPRWVSWIGAGVSFIILAISLVRRHLGQMEKAE